LSEGKPKTAASATGQAARAPLEPSTISTKTNGTTRAMIGHCRPTMAPSTLQGRSVILLTVAIGTDSAPKATGAIADRDTRSGATRRLAQDTITTIPGRFHVTKGLRTGRRLAWAHLITRRHSAYPHVCHVGSVQAFAATVGTCIPSDDGSSRDSRSRPRSTLASRRLPQRRWCDPRPAKLILILTLARTWWT
jgi:hypothetical protein